MRCARPQEPGYLCEGMVCYRTKMLVGHHLHAKWISVRSSHDQKTVVTYMQQLH